MSATILNGNKIAAEIKAELASDIRELARAGIKPGLAAVLVGHDPASEVYVRNKIKACEELGLYSEKITPPENISNDEMLALVRELNQREEIDGLLIQLPLPKQVSTRSVLLAIDPEKDVDGFHPLNVGAISTNRDAMVPCTPAGIIQILKRSAIPILGQHAVVVGRSEIVGKPVATLLLNESATVTICHSRTTDLARHTRMADILVAAIGKPGLISKDMVKPGAAVIDVGIVRVSDPKVFAALFKGDEKRERDYLAKGFVLAGDVHPNVAQVAGAITPVPGGVGPLTIAMLMSNTVKATKLRRGLSKSKSSASAQLVAERT